MTLSGSLPAASVGVSAGPAKPSASRKQASQCHAATVRRRAHIGCASTPTAGDSGIAGPTNLCFAPAPRNSDKGPRSRSRMALNQLPDLTYERELPLLQTMERVAL